MRYHLLENAKQYIGVERALVCLIHDDSGVFRQIIISERLAQQHPIRHVLNKCLLRGDIFEPNGVADLSAQLATNFLGHALSHAHCGHSPRLRAADNAKARITILVKVLRNLCRLPRASLPHKYYHRVVANNCQQLASAAEDREELALLRDSLGLRKLGRSLQRFTHVRTILSICLVGAAALILFRIGQGSCPRCHGRDSKLIFLHV
mmetsp:Transcript_28720/g.47593  ORF Transcript_28720/g.47593 Transcript_28720/m.47593 type:complete len:207 (-) Transcript_28720:343-963(-)